MMEKILKAIAMILLVAAVVSAAGCAGKTNTAENENQAASGQVTPTSTVTYAETPTSAATPAETSTSAVTPAAANENVTGNTTAQTGTHLSNVQRKQAIAQNRTLSSGTQSVKN
jgi:hypothetical protein